MSCPRDNKKFRCHSRRVPFQYMRTHVRCAIIAHSCEECLRFLATTSSRLPKFGCAAQTAPTTLRPHSSTKEIMIQLAPAIQRTLIMTTTGVHHTIHSLPVTRLLPTPPPLNLPTTSMWPLLASPRPRYTPCTCPSACKCTYLHSVRPQQHHLCTIMCGTSPDMCM